MRQRIDNAADIRFIESRPYDEVVEPHSILDLLVGAAVQHGQGIALCQLSSGEPDDESRAVTYQQLLESVQRAANLFRRLGAGADDGVAILLPAMPEAHYALWGGTIATRACPLNYMLSVESLVELLRAARARVLVALGPHPDFEIWPRAQQLAAAIPGLRLLQVGAQEAVEADSFQELLAREPSDLTFEPALERSRIAAYYHTGGTTGAPKLAMHTHGNEVHTSWFAGMYYQLGPGKTLLNGFPLFHVAGAFVYGAACFCAGATIVMPPLLGMRHRRFVENYWRFVERYHVTHLAAVPTIIATLVDTPSAGSDISSVEVLYTGGSPLPTELAHAFEKTHGIAVRNILGMTESAGLVAIEPLGAARRAGSCGLPLPYTRVSIRPLGADASGMVVIEGPHVSPGYTDARRNADMFEAGRYLISGDLGHLDEVGCVHITGRAKDVIIRGAHNIDPSVIEEAFAKHPDVQSCAAVGEPDRYAGEVPVVFLSLRAQAQVAGDQILADIVTHIPEPAAIPKRVTILPTLPTTAIGKIFKPALRALATEHAFGDALKAVAVLGPVELDVSGVAHGAPVKVRFDGGPRPEAKVAALHAALHRFSVPYELVAR